MLPYILGLALHLIPSSVHEAELKNLQPWYERADSVTAFEQWELVHRGAHVFLARGDAQKLPVVLVHGLNLDARMFTNCNFDTARFYTVAYQFPESSPVYQGSMDDMVGLLDDFIEQMQWEQFILCGVSFGGMVSQAYGARGKHKDRIAGIGLISTMVMGASTQSVRQNARWHDKVVTAHNDNRIYSLMNFAIGIAKKRMKGDRKPLRPLLEVKHPAYYRQVIRATHDLEGVKISSNISAPVAIVHGSDDTTVDTDEYALTKALYPDAPARLIQGAEHSLAFTHADEMVAFFEPLFVAWVKHTGD